MRRCRLLLLGTTIGADSDGAVESLLLLNTMQGEDGTIMLCRDGVANCWRRRTTTALCGGDCGALSAAAVVVICEEEGAVVVSMIVVGGLPVV
jgi:hypothetical protein